MILGSTLLLFPVMLFFCWFAYDAIKRVPKEKHYFPGWFCWLMMIPLVGYIFLWLMLPFGLPLSFKRVVDENNEAARKSIKKLFGLGLAWVIVQLFGLFPPCFIALIVLIILYWVEMNRFKRHYLYYQS